MTTPTAADLLNDFFGISLFVDASYREPGGETSIFFTPEAERALIGEESDDDPA